MTIQGDTSDSSDKRQRPNGLRTDPQFGLKAEPIGSLLLNQAVPAGLGHLPFEPCRAAGKEPSAGGTRELRCLLASRGEEGAVSRRGDGDGAEAKPGSRERWHR